jgi:hypothetical protein
MCTCTLCMIILAGRLQSTCRQRVCLQARQCACTEDSVRACRECSIRQAGKGVSADKRVLVKGEWTSRKGSIRAGMVVSGQAVKSPWRQENVQAGRVAWHKAGGVRTSSRMSVQEGQFTGLLADRRVWVQACVQTGFFLSLWIHYV